MGVFHVDTRFVACGQAVADTSRYIWHPQLLLHIRDDDASR